MAEDDDSRLPGLRQGRKAAWVPFVLTLAALVLLSVWGVRIYEDLPDTIPTHWGPGGDARPSPYWGGSPC